METAADSAKLNMNNCIVLACGSLASYVQAAQQKLGTNYPVIYLDKTLHAYPERMNASIIEKLQTIPPEYDTVLVAMGYCGGSWKDIVSNKKIVRPVADDCVTILLHTKECSGYDLKKRDHLYMKDVNALEFDLPQAFENYTKDMPAEERAKTKALWQSIYSTVDIVDTGLNNCHTPEYQASAEKNAHWINGRVEHLTGSNILIEKLLAGDWDEKLFIIEEPKYCRSV